MMIAEEMWKSNVQLNAGYPLLTRYERLWSFIHENNIDLCREAEVRLLLSFYLNPKRNIKIENYTLLY